MASYINKKDRVFYPAGDCPPQFHRQRPEACLKTYYSCTDTRVWELAEEPRRQHLREILSTPVGLQLGNYVPIEMLINILMCSDAEVCIKEDYNSNVGYHRSYGTSHDTSSCLCCNSSASRQIKTCGTQCPPLKPYTSKEAICTDKDKEVQKLNCQIEKLECDIKCAKKNIYDNEKQICHMSNEIKDKNREILEKNKEIQCIKKGLSDNDNEITSLKNELIQKSNEIEIIKTELSDKSNEMETLKTELCQKSNFTTESLKKLELLNRKLHDSECDRKELGRKNCEQQKLIQKLENECIKPSKMCDLQQELNKLREYCQFLSKAQEQAEKHSECLNTENQGLKIELRGCHQSLADQSGKLAELHSNADNLKHMLMEKDGEICRLKKDVTSLQEEIRYQSLQLKDTFAKTPDKCNCTHNSAEEKARKYKQKFKELESQLRELSCACGKTKKDLQQMECLQKERDMLQRRVDELCSIEQAYNSCRNQLCDMQNIMAERDMLRMKLLNMSTVEEEVERLRCKTKEMDCLRAEKNRLKQRNEELEAIEAQYIELLSVQKELEAVKCERDRLKCKIEEVMRQNYDKQRQICEMETELKQLIAQIDHMTEEECRQEIKKLSTQNQCLMRCVNEKQQLVNHYKEKFEIIDKTKDELKDVQDDIINSINEFNIQQQLNDNLYQFLCREHNLNSTQLEEIIDYLTQLVACDCQDLSEIKCKIIQKISNLKSILDTYNKKFTLQVKDIINLNNYTYNENIDISRSIYGSIIDETHRQYNNEISKMEEIIMNYENQFKSIHQLPLNIDQAQYMNIKELKNDRCKNLQQIDQSQCTTDDDSTYENDITCLLLHEIEYKTSEIEHDEEELQQLRSQAMNSTFNSICEQINEIVVRCESEHKSINHMDLNNQIIDLIKSIEYKRNEIDYIQNELNVLIKNNGENEEIEYNINEIIRLHDIIERDLQELNNLKVRVNVSESVLLHENDQILRQIYLIRKEVQLKENKVHELQLNLERLSESDCNIEIEDMEELTKLIKTLKNEIENDRNELKNLFDLASNDENNDNKQGLVNYLMGYFRKTDSMVTALLKHEQTLNKYLSTVKKLKNLIEKNEDQIKNLYHNLQDNRDDRKLMIQIIDRINQLQNNIYKYQNDIIRILINIPTTTLHNIECDEIKAYLLTVQRLANENIKAENDLNYLKQQQSLFELEGNIDKLNEIENNINKINKKIRKNRENICTISTLLTLLPRSERLPVYGKVSSVSCIKGDKYALSIRTLRDLIEHNQTHLNHLKEQKIQVSQDQMQYRNRVYHLQGVINKYMKEILNLIKSLQDESLLNIISDLQSKQLNIFSDYSKVLKMLEQLTKDEIVEIVQIQDKITNAQKQICYDKIRNEVEQINENYSTNSRSSHLDIDTSTIVQDICELLTKVESAQRNLEHCAIHLSQILDGYNTLSHDSDKEVQQMENEIQQFNNIIKILDRCKEIEENDSNDVGKYLTEIQILKKKVDQLQMKLEQSENMVVYMDAIKHLHSHIAKIDQQNRIQSHIELHQEMTMNYIQKLTHAVDKLHLSKKVEPTSTAPQSIQIDIPKSVEDDRLEISDVPIEVYNLKVHNDELHTTQEDLLSQIRAMEEENKQYHEDIDALQIKYQTALEEINALELKYQNTLQDLENCNVNSSNITTQYEEEINVLKEKIIQLRSQLDTITEESIRLMQVNENEQPQADNYHQTISSYSTEQSVKKILSNQSQNQKYIEELEKRIENYTFIIQTIGSDGHFSHLFLMIGESIRSLEEKLREAYDQIAILRWNALVDENLTKMAKSCLKEMHDKLDESKNESTIRELMNTIHQLEDKIQIIKRESKVNKKYGDNADFSKYHYVSSESSVDTSKPPVQSIGLSKLYTNVNVQTVSINLVTGDAYVQTDKPGKKSDLSKNFVLDLDIEARNSECISAFQFTESQISTIESGTITAAHVQIHTNKINEQNKQTVMKHPKINLSDPSQHLWSFKSMMHNESKLQGQGFNDERTISESASSSVSHNTMYSSPCESQYIVQSNTTNLKTFNADFESRRGIRHSVRGFSGQSKKVTKEPLPTTTVHQRFSYRGSPQSYTTRPQNASTLENFNDLLEPDANLFHGTHFVQDVSQPHTFCLNKSNRSSTTRKSSQTDKNSTRTQHIYSDNSKNSEFIEQMNAFATPTAPSITNQNFSGLRGSRIKQKYSKNPHNSNSYSLRGTSTTVGGTISYQQAHTSQILDDSQQQNSTNTSMQNCATLRGSFLNHLHHYDHHSKYHHDVYSWRGTKKSKRICHNESPMINPIPAQNLYIGGPNNDPIDLQRYINLGGLYSFPKKQSKEKIPFNIKDQDLLKSSLTYSDVGVDDTPLRKHSSSHLNFPLMGAFNEVVALKQKLADFEDQAAQNLANLKKQYERNAKCLIDEHNKSVSKLSFMQDETIRQLENENDKLRNQVHHLLQKLTNHKNACNLSSTSTGEIDIPPYTTMHTMHLQNKKIFIKTENDQKTSENVKNQCADSYDPKKVSICYHDDVSCTESYIPRECCPESCFPKQCGLEPIPDCDEECGCVYFADKAIQTKPTPRAKISATRSMANILTKFLYEGLQRLDIFELSKLHSRVCYAAQTLIEEEKEKKMSQEEKIIHQINKMEDKLIRKQKSAQEKLKLLEICMEQEKRRICVMRAEIETEKGLALSPCLSESTEELQVCHSTQANFPMECTCNHPIEPCASDPCKTKSILKTCSEPKSVIVCPGPFTSNQDLNCVPEAFPECISTRMLEDYLEPCKPRAILKGCIISPKPTKDLCRPRNTQRMILDSPSGNKKQQELSEQCGTVIGCKSSKSTSVLCQSPTTRKRNRLSCELRSTPQLYGLSKSCDQSTITPDYDKCADILPKSQPKFPYIRVPTKYQIDNRQIKSEPKECICTQKDKSPLAFSKTCCGCRDDKTNNNNNVNNNKLLSKSKNPSKVGNYEFLAKCAPSLYKRLNKQKS